MTVVSCTDGVVKGVGLYLTDTGPLQFIIRGHCLIMLCAMLFAALVLVVWVPLALVVVWVLDRAFGR